MTRLGDDGVHDAAQPAERRLGLVQQGRVAGGSQGHIHVPAQRTAALDGHPVELRFRDALSAPEVRRAVSRIKAAVKAEHPDITRVYFGAEAITEEDD